MTDKTWIDIAQALSWPFIIMAFGYFLWKWFLPFVNKQIDKREDDLKTFMDAMREHQRALGDVVDSLKALKEELQDKRRKDTRP